MTGTVATFVGPTTASQLGYVDGTPTVARFRGPSVIAHVTSAAAAGTATGIVVTDANSHAIRLVAITVSADGATITPDNTTNVAGTTTSGYVNRAPGWARHGSTNLPAPL